MSKGQYSEGWGRVTGVDPPRPPRKVGTNIFVFHVDVYFRFAVLVLVS